MKNEFNNITDHSVNETFNKWRELINQENNKEDVWTTIPYFPQYEFKNLKIINSKFQISDDENINMNLTINYDDIKSSEFIDNFNLDDLKIFFEKGWKAGMAEALSKPQDILPSFDQHLDYEIGKIIHKKKL